ncbi:MAG: molybdate transporter family protein [Hyphomicrobiales bacterium]
MSCPLIHLSGMSRNEPHISGPGRQPPQGTDPSGAGSAGSRAHAVAGDISGAWADLGTFLPLVLGVLTVGHMNPVSVLFGFGAFALATAAIYRRPVPVQPMKAVAAIVIATGLSTSGIAATGILLGVVLLLLAISGSIDRIRRALPQSVLSGVSLGVGLYLALTGLRLMAGDWMAGLGIFTLVGLLLFTRFAPYACLAGLGVAILLGLWGGADLSGLIPGFYLPTLTMPDMGGFRDSLETVFVPQLMLTVANAVLATAAIAATYFPSDAGRNITPRRLALSTGGLNLLLAPLGALPMCHGAGGLVAQHRFGARSWLAPALFGATCLGLGLVFGDGVQAILAILPLAALGALLAIAGGDMALSRRLFDGRPDCLAVILFTAAACVAFNVAAGVVAGLAAEFVRARAVRRMGQRSP